ncbi:aspartic protease [Aphelenchoides avenae]|nr:aspartic protease [Aphelenchus avenae]
MAGTDDFKFAGKAAQRVPLAAVKTVEATVQPFWPSDGIFSLTTYGVTNNSAVYRIASSVGQPQITLHMKRTRGYPSGDRVGTLTFGGRDAKNCDNTWTALPVGVPESIAFTFNTNAQSVSLGATEVYKNSSKVFFDVTWATIGVPAAVFPLIGEKLNATYDAKTQFYVIPCASVKDAPPLTFRMKGLDYVIPAVDYIRNLVPRSDNLCTVLMDTTDDGSIDWALGVPAMRSFCWNFDYDANIASVAKAIQDF